MVLIMSELQKELIKILVDKGLLALIALGVAYYLNRAIERYKASNVYFQKVSEARIQAYQEISKTLSSDYFLLQDYLRSFMNYHEDHTSKSDEKIDKLLSILENIRKSFLGHRVLLATLDIYFSVEIRGAITKYMKNTNDFFAVLDARLKDDQQQRKEHMEQIKKADDGVGQSYDHLRHMLGKEINANPFA
jgi:hypothetical protein